MNARSLFRLHFRSLSTAIWIIRPTLPFCRCYLKDVEYVTVDRLGDFLVDRVHPFNVLRYNLLRYLSFPFTVLNVAFSLRRFQRIYVGCHSAGDAISKVMVKRFDIHHRNLSVSHANVRGVGRREATYPPPRGSQCMSLIPESAENGVGLIQRF